MGGFESSNHVDRSRRRVDYVALTQHDRFFRQDYERARAIGIRTVREVVRWPLCDREGRIDLSSFTPLAEAAQAAGLAQINCLFHYGYPDDLHPFDERFAPRFVAFAEAVARWRRANVELPRWYGVTNEVSLFSYAAGDAGWFAPFLSGAGVRLKEVMVRATLEATAAIRAIDPHARFLSIDPVRHVAPPRGRPDLLEESVAASETQYEAWDIALGRTKPELGGREDAFEAVGINCYPDGQRERGGDEELALDDPRRKPLRVVLREVWERYRRPVFLAETSARGAQRPVWLRYVTDEVIAALRDGVDVQGVCLFPLVDMREWEGGQVGEWGRLGVWDVHEDGGTVHRVPNAPYLRAIGESARRIGRALAQLHAAGDAKYLARDVARVTRREIDEHRGQLGGLRGAPDGRGVPERLHILQRH
jgi:beta-glucosidase/6-phospho-beta-glucosidase/beta-galactosidase